MRQHKELDYIFDNEIDLKELLFEDVVESQLEDSILNACKAIDAMEKEILRLSHDKKILDARVAELRACVADSMNRHDITQVYVEDRQVILKQKPAKCVIEDEDMIPARYVEMKRTINKKVLLCDLTDGKAVEGAHLADTEYTIAIKK